MKGQYACVWFYIDKWNFLQQYMMIQVLHEYKCIAFYKILNYCTKERGRERNEKQKGWEWGKGGSSRPALSLPSTAGGYMMNVRGLGDLTQDIEYMQDSIRVTCRHSWLDVAVWYRRKLALWKRLYSVRYQAYK